MFMRFFVSGRCVAGWNMPVNAKFYPRNFSKRQDQIKYEYVYNYPRLLGGHHFKSYHGHQYKENISIINHVYIYGYIYGAVDANPANESGRPSLAGQAQNRSTAVPWPLPGPVSLNPPTSSERRACETLASHPSLLGLSIAVIKVVNSLQSQSPPTTLPKRRQSNFLLCSGTSIYEFANS